ncbi:MAG: hypothetical protein E2O29_01775 [Deltaproteobacteria bacterium]|nr:MAG: hypothetical protein E2O29_01775 [Deltaproteobacteria bacterium]
MIDLNTNTKIKLEKNKQVSISKITRGYIAKFRSHVSFLYLDINRGGTLNIRTIRGYAIGGVFNKYMYGMGQDGTQKLDVPLDKQVFMGYLLSIGTKHKKG